MVLAAFLFMKRMAEVTNITIVRRPLLLRCGREAPAFGAREGLTSPDPLASPRVGGDLSAMDPDLLLADLAAGKTAALARAISVVENGRPGFERLLAGVHRSLGRARRIGITGPPGAGKSTLVERLVIAYRSAGLRVGVVAVDPTSPFTGGALLGDRIRMESVALDEGVYIRSMASRGSLGGLATSTREVCDLLDAAGFDRILVETVGVGQSELDVARMADATILVLVPESGDGIQTLKSGVMEAADIFAVNKADRPGADQLRQEIEITLGIRRGNAYRNMPAHHGSGAAGRRGSGAAKPIGGLRRSEPTAPPPRGPAAPPEPWDHPVVLTVAAKGEGVDELIAALDRHHEWLGRSGTLEERRRRRMLERTREVVDRAARRWIWGETHAEQLISDRLDQVVDGRLSPYDVATEVLDGLKQGARL
jgi:LAO/AO transport system kinase